jgi:hypothetical protein
VGCVVVLVAIAAGPAAGRIIEGTTEAEFYGGAYLPGPGELDTAFALGLHGGRNFSESYKLQIGFGYARSDGARVGDMGGKADLELTLTFIDATFVYHVMPRRRWVTLLYGGPSWAFADLVADIDPVDEPLFVEGLRKDSFSFHFGAGGKYDINRTWSLIPALRWRWFEKRDTGDLDYEITLGVGYTSLP